jgi:hypothetical protein
MVVVLTDDWDDWSSGCWMSFGAVSNMSKLTLNGKVESALLER